MHKEIKDQIEGFNFFNNEDSISNILTELEKTAVIITNIDLINSISKYLFYINIIYYKIFCYLCFY